MSGTVAKWRTAAALAAVAIGMCLQTGGPVAAQAPARQSVIVVLDQGVDARAAAPALAARVGGQVGAVFDQVLGGFHFEGPAPAVAALSRAAGVTAVVPDERFSLVDVAGYGIFRIEADRSISNPAGPYRGAGVRVAIVDSGVDTDHPDLAPNLEPGAGANCQSPGAPPEDDNGHGTHVAGIAAAAFNPDGYGVVGAAPEAGLAPFKAFDASGFADTSDIVCALDALAELVTAVPMPTVLNMSFADVGTDSTCDDGDPTDVLHEAICDVVSVGEAAGAPVIPVAAAGNDARDAATTIPAAFSDVITVSALADHDGTGGGLAGCPYLPLMFNWECDDTIASFSNWGEAVDVIAPGVDIYSTVPGGHDYLSGTSMAAPHVSGVVAAVLAEHASLDVAGVLDLLARTGECPDGSTAGADASCSGQGQWQRTTNRSIFDPVGTGPDPDGIPEPLVNADRATVAADAEGDPAPPPPPPPPPPDAAPGISLGTPVPGATVSGPVAIAGTASDDSGVTSVEVFVDGALVGTTVPAADGVWSIVWDSTSVADGGHDVVARATDTAGQQTDTAPRAITVANSSPAGLMHVAGLLGSASNGRKWTATVTVDVADQTGAPVPGATVTFDVGAGVARLAAKGGTPGGPGGGGGGGGGGGSDSGTLSCVTDAAGRCSASLKPSGSTVMLTVTGIARDGWTYDPAANVATAIEITRG